MKVPHPMPLRRPSLTHVQILAWADDHLERTGRLPNVTNGLVLADLNESWMNINQALRLGLRGLPGKDSLALLLQRERGHRHLHNLPPLTEEIIVAWARSHLERTGQWPTENSGDLPDSPGENWNAINQCLRDGDRGCPGGDTLAQLLARHGATNYTTRTKLSKTKILRWARAYRQETGSGRRRIRLRLDSPKAKTGNSLMLHSGRVLGACREDRRCRIWWEGNRRGDWHSWATVIAEEKGT